MNMFGKGVSDAADEDNFGTSRWPFEIKISTLQNSKEQLYEVVFRPHDSIQTNALKILIETIQATDFHTLAEVFYKAGEIDQQNFIKLWVDNYKKLQGDRPFFISQHGQQKWM